jgi:hypothetical protein
MGVRFSWSHFYSNPEAGRKIKMIIIPKLLITARNIGINQADSCASGGKVNKEPPLPGRKG